MKKYEFKKSKGVWGGTFPHEPKPTKCAVKDCRGKVIRTEQSFIGQLLVGFCDKHSEVHLTYGFGMDGPLGSNAKFELWGD
jgi:hypothetical protein